MSDPTPRALVTGGAGFIGSHLVDRLLADGWMVAAVDSFDPFYPAERKRRHLATAATNPRFQLYECDTRDGDRLRGVMEEARPQVVFDLAARAGVRPSIADPGPYVDINVGGLVNTLAASAAVGARVVFGSSSSIYGNDERRPFQEDQARGRPVSPYGATKVAGEALVHAHHAVTGLPVSVARLFTVYGPRQRPDLAIYTFATRMLRGEPIQVFGSGTIPRDYTFVEDVVDALVRLAATDAPCLVVNVGSDRPITNGAMVEALERVLGVRAIRHDAPHQVGDALGTHADITRAREVLGWEPRMRFEDGLRRFADWLRSEGPTGG